VTSSALQARRQGTHSDAVLRVRPIQLGHNDVRAHARQPSAVARPCHGGSSDYRNLSLQLAPLAANLPVSPIRVGDADLVHIMQQTGHRTKEGNGPNLIVISST